MKLDLTEAHAIMLLKCNSKSRWLFSRSQRYNVIKDALMKDLIYIIIIWRYIYIYIYIYGRVVRDGAVVFVACHVVCQTTKWTMHAVVVV